MKKWDQSIGFKSHYKNKLLHPFQPLSLDNLTITKPSKVKFEEFSKNIKNKKMLNQFNYDVVERGKTE